MSTNEDDVRANTFQLIVAYRDFMSQQRWEEWIKLWAEDGVLEFPFAPTGRQRIYRGRAEIQAYMSAAAGKIAIDSMENMRLHSMQDPEIAAVELSVKGHAVTNGRPYNQSYVLFFETKDGKLKHYREYWNPLVSMEAFGEEWNTAFGKPEAGSKE